MVQETVTPSVCCRAGVCPRGTCQGCNGASAMEMGAGGRKQHLELSKGESRAEEVVASATDPVGLL